MGEYHTQMGPDGKRTLFKFGTCEDWRYVRRAEVERVRYLDTNDELMRWALGLDSGDGALFRFPWPDEDGNTTADISGRSMFRSHRVWVDLDVEHSHMTVSINPGMKQHGVPHTNLMVPCPTTLPAPQRDPERRGYTYTNLPAVSCGPARQVYNLIGERQILGERVTVLECAWCEARFRVHAPEEVQAIREALRAAGDDAIADRVACDPEGEAWIAKQPQLELF